MIVHMNKQIILKQLNNLGLEDIEAIIYLYLLEHGPRTHLELSRETNIDRSKIYRDVERLKSKKLLEESNNARGQKLRAANPQNLELLIHEKEQEIKIQKDNLPDILRELTSLPSDEQINIEIKHYRGTDGLKQMLWNHMAAKKENLVFG